MSRAINDYNAFIIAGWGGKWLETKYAWHRNTRLPEAHREKMIISAGSNTVGLSTLLLMFTPLLDILKQKYMLYTH